MAISSLAEMRVDYIAIKKWKAEMTLLVKERFGDGLSEDKINKFLDRKVMEHGRNPKAVLVNNYINKEVKTNLLEIIDYIETQHLIIGGEGCLFVQHPENDDDVHVILKFIRWVQAQRKIFKKEREKFSKGTLDWVRCDLGQNNKKLKINGLYGCLGCGSFILFNRFLAESITNGGRQIICSAAITFENFLGVKVKYNFESEVFTFIHRVRNEIKSKYPNGIDCSPFYFENMRYKVKEKLCDRCAFPLDIDFVNNLDAVLESCSNDELCILYYKNNLMEFSKTPIIRAKLKYIMSNIDQLRSPEIEKFVNSTDPNVSPISQEVFDAINELEKFYETFVMYTEPMFDRVRKTMFTDRDKVLYTDTDSTFLALNEWVTFIKNDILGNYYHIEEMEMNFIAVNVITYILGFVIARGLLDMGLNMNITEKWARLLVMKNEFYLAMIVFTNAKKRYISDAVLQEGVLLRDKKTGEIGYPEIKGFDFKKAVVKPYVTNYYTDLSIHDILRAKTIRVDQVYLKLLKLKSDIEKSIRSGSHEYYKQAKVQLVEQYKKPYQVQGVRAVLLWNCIFDNMPMELPVDVDIVPIKVISDKKGRAWLQETLPEVYEKVNKTFWQSDNELIRDMELKVIAVPKNDTEYPDWFFDLIDEDKIVTDILSLFYPIMESLGLSIDKVGKKTYLTNMVDL